MKTVLAGLRDGTLFLLAVGLAFCLGVLLRGGFG